jgi:hypothetical protein
MPNLYMVQDHRTDVLGRSMAFHTMPWFGEYVFSNAHNSNLTPKFATFFCPSYFMTQEASVAPRVSATRHVIQINGLTSGSSPNTRARGA